MKDQFYAHTVYTVSIECVECQPKLIHAHTHRYLCIGYQNNMECRLYQNPFFKEHCPREGAIPRATDIY